MKTRIYLKHTLVIVCALALLIGFAPLSAHALDFDFSAYNAQVQAALDAQLQAQQQMQQEAQSQSQEWLDSFFFDVEAAYRHMMSLKSPAEQEKYFFSLNVYQRAKLVEYLQYKASIGEFKGFDEKDEALEALIKAESEGKVKTDAEKEAEFAAFYANEIELYRQYGDFADLSHLPYEVVLHIKSYVAAEKAAAEAPAEEAEAETEESAEASEEEVEAPAEEAEAVEAEAAPAEENPEAPVEAALTEEAASAAEEAAPTAEEMFEADYAHYINLYREFGQYADLSGVSYEVQQQIKALVDGPAEAEPVAEEAVAEVPEAEEAEEPETAEAAAEEVEAVEAEVAEVEASEAVELTTAPAEIPASEIVIPESPKAVAITSSLTDVIAINEPVTLTGVLEDVENFTDIVYIWEVDKGNGFERVEGENAQTLTFPATVESLGWNWRLSILYR